MRAFAAVAAALVGIVAVGLIASLVYIDQGARPSDGPYLRSSNFAPGDGVSVTVAREPILAVGVVVVDDAKYEREAALVSKQVDNLDIRFFAALPDFSLRLNRAIRWPARESVEFEKLGIRFSLAAQFHSNLNIDVYSWRLSDVFNDHLADRPDFSAYELLNSGGFNRDICAELGPGGSVCAYGRPYTNSQSYHGDEGGDRSDSDLSPCRYFLPFSGCSSTLSGISGPYLGVQIGSIVIVGFLFAFLGVGGLFLCFDNRNWQCVAAGIVAAAFGAAGLLFSLRWCRFLRQGHKVGRPMKRTIQHEDTQTIYGRVQGQGCA